ncbi:MAG: 6-phospho-3-hexuloisomerase [Lachnospiraceae bacterium]|nr:6-phospho-3-hexuloisomerase [Lachnospiraceae bacterium]
MNVREYTEIVIRELKDTMEKVLPEGGEQLTNMILNAKKILVAGAGRSGLAAKAFAMRLMHMGFDVYVCGETITPNLESEDLFFVVSGSGTTGSLVSMTQKAKAIGAAVATVTICPNGAIGQLADLIVEIPAPTPKANVGQNYTSIQPMGSLFEQSCLLYLDCVILRLMEKKQNDSASMFTRHANLE